MCAAPLRNDTAAAAFLSLKKKKREREKESSKVSSSMDGTSGVEDVCISPAVRAFSVAGTPSFAK